MSEPQLNRRLSPMDAFFLYLETEAQPMHVGAVCLFDGKLSYQGFLRQIESRLHLVPRYRQRVVPAPLNLGHPTWENDPDFDIKNHVFRVKLDAPGDEEQLRRLAGKIFTGVLDRSKPLWEVYLVEGLKDNRTALIFKVHHCMVDGVAGVSLAFILFDMTPETVKVKKVPPPRDPLPDTAQLLYDALWDNAIEGIEHWTRFQRSLAAFGQGFDVGDLASAITKFGTTMGNFLLPFPKLPFNRQLEGGRVMAWREYYFADARAIRAMAGGTVNDVVLTTIGSAMRKYATERGGLKKLPKTLRVLAPVNVRHESERAALGNRISFMPIEVPLQPENPLERLHEVHVRTRELKEKKLAQAVSLMFEALQGMPAPLQASALSTVAKPTVQSLVSMVTAIPPGNTIVTNVPGPQIPLYVMGRRMLSLYPLVPVCLEMGVNFAITSYDQKIFVAVCADSATDDDALRIADLLDESFEELRTAAEVTQANYVRITRSQDESTAPGTATPSPAEKPAAGNARASRKSVSKPAEAAKATSGAAAKAERNGNGAHKPKTSKPPRPRANTKKRTSNN